MPSLAESYPRLVAALTEFYGQAADIQGNDSCFEAVVEAGLNRRPDRSGRDPLLAALDRFGLLEPETLAAAAPTEIRDTLRQAGIALSPSAATLLVRLARWYADSVPGDEGPAELSQSTLREQLAHINGVGPATALAILLALGFPVYPLDRASYRILVRHGWADCTSDPEELSQTLGRLAGDDHRAIWRLSRWFSQIGRQFCVPGKPKCSNCPLRELLPEGGPVELDF